VLWLALGFGPGGGSHVGDLAEVEFGEAGEDVAQIGKRVEATATAAFYDRVEDGCALASVGGSDEEPVLLPNGGGTDGVFDVVVVDLDAAISRIAFRTRIGEEPDTRTVGVRKVNQGGLLIAALRAQRDDIGEATLCQVSYGMALALSHTNIPAPMELALLGRDPGVCTNDVTLEDAAIRGEGADLLRAAARSLRASLPLRLSRCRPRDHATCQYRLRHLK
jgi:hypothetical protein